MRVTREAVLTIPLSVSNAKAAAILGCGKGAVSGHRWRAAKGCLSMETRPKPKGPPIGRTDPNSKYNQVLIVMADGRVRNSSDVCQELPDISQSGSRWALAKLTRMGLLTRIDIGLYQDQSE
jgi:hypothetical protein